VNRTGIAGALAAALALAGARPAAADKNAFFRELNEKPQAEVRDLVTAVHILARDRHEEKSFESMRAELAVEGILPSGWTYKAESPVTVGMVAYGVCGALAKVPDGAHGIPGGLTMTLFGNSQRYALRECRYLGIIPAETGRTPRGADLLGILARAAAYRKTGSAQTLQFGEGDVTWIEAEIGELQKERMRQQEGSKK